MEYKRLLQESGIPVHKLPKAFTSDLSKDAAKRCIIPGKWILQTILAWPDTDNPYVVAANWFLFINMIVVEIFHATYTVVYRADLGNALLALATVTTTLEGLVRFQMIFFKKHLFNDILHKIWKKFWPLSVLSSTKEVEILKRRCYTTLGLTIGCYGPAVICNVVLTLGPYLTGDGLILKSVYPFEWNTTYAYEAVYTWQYFTQWYILILVNTFDSFAIPMMMICAVQFVVWQDIFRNIFTVGSKKQRLALFGKEVNDEEMISICLEQQNMLFEICQKLEEIFSFAILFQFGNSILALCSSCVILKVDQSKFFEMFTFAVAHMFQLFNYCYVGSELAVQSENMAVAIYDCNWQDSDDLKFKKVLPFMLQRSQKVRNLTAAGITPLDFISYVKVLRISFSFYTLLDTLFDSE
uniref:Odorant receptor n=1 Tax=Protaetia brevitarsis TaxID=348688 RepID=A0A411HRA0_PROBE|nr:odorant receptor [Protaetia brevitarsis]